jgi:hypothetical protein
MKALMKISSEINDQLHMRRKMNACIELCNGIAYNQKSTPPHPLSLEIAILSDSQTSSTMSNNASNDNALIKKVEERVSQCIEGYRL